MNCMQPSESERSALRQEASRIEESAQISAQGQFEAAKIWRTANWIVGAITVAASSVAAVLTFSTDRLQVAAGILAITAAISAAVQTTLKPDKRAELAQAVANDYLALQGNARRLINIDTERDDPTAIRTTIDTLAVRQEEINRRADVIPKRAYKLAKKGIAAGGQVYAADANAGKITS